MFSRFQSLLRRYTHASYETTSVYCPFRLFIFGAHYLWCNDSFRHVRTVSILELVTGVPLIPKIIGDNIDLRTPWTIFVLTYFVGRFTALRFTRSEQCSAARMYGSINKVICQDTSMKRQRKQLYPLNLCHTLIKKGRPFFVFFGRKKPFFLWNGI